MYLLGFTFCAEFGIQSAKRVPSALLPSRQAFSVRRHPMSSKRKRMSITKCMSKEWHFIGGCDGHYECSDTETHHGRHAALCNQRCTVLAATPTSEERLEIDAQFTVVVNLKMVLRGGYDPLRRAVIPANQKGSFRFNSESGWMEVFPLGKMLDIVISPSDSPIDVEKAVRQRKDGLGMVALICKADPKLNSSLLQYASALHVFRADVKLTLRIFKSKCKDGLVLVPSAPLQQPNAGSDGQLDVVQSVLIPFAQDSAREGGSSSSGTPTGTASSGSGDLLDDILPTPSGLSPPGLLLLSPGTLMEIGQEISVTAANYGDRLTQIEQGR